ncbi:MAG TPA: DVUA0089 family protein, partial [Aggregatilineales bacterium]|nr:DVUA0089 family protein [Aggregatilineales bacterium]
MVFGKSVMKVVMILAVMLLAGQVVMAGSGGELIPGVIVQGEIAVRDEQDVYTYAGRAGESITITANALTDSTLDSLLQVFDPVGDLLTQNDDAAPETSDARVQITLSEDGEYRVSVSSFASASSGTYELILVTTIAPETASSGDDGTTTTTSELSPGTAVQGELESGEAQSWFFTPDEDLRVQVAMFSLTFDSYLEVYDADGQLVASDDDSGGGYNAAILGVPLNAGQTYEIRTTSYENSAAGEYILVLNIAPPPLDVVEIGFDDSVDGTMVPGREILYTFSAAAGDRIRVRITSEFDPYLVLRDADGLIIAEDDDSGGDLQPLLSNVTLPADGIYTVTVSGYSNFDEGSFTITLSYADSEIASSGGEIAYGESADGFLIMGETRSHTFIGSVDDLVSVEVTG